jgi:hypothetical protein
MSLVPQRILQEPLLNLAVLTEVRGPFGAGGVVDSEGHAKGDSEDLA